MRTTEGQIATKPKTSAPAQHGRGLPIVLATVGGVAGIIAGAMWFYSVRHAQKGEHAPLASVQSGFKLTATTRAILDQLDSPVEIRYYALLDSVTVPPATQLFAQHADTLLAAFEQASGGKLHLTRKIAPPTDAEAAALAKADGLKPFNLDKSDACYLGLAMVQGSRKEVLQQLLPDWEPALESDLSRALAHLGQRSAPPLPFSAPSLASNSVPDLKSQLPNYASLSFEEGSQRLRELSVLELQSALQEMGTQIQAAEDRLQSAQNGSSESERQTAFNELQRLRMAQSERLKQIAARASDRIETLRQLKEASR